MHELKVNLKNGDLFLNKLPFQFKTEKFYLESIKNIKDMEDKPLLVNGYHKYGGYDKLTKIIKHAKRNFWLNDICTCHGLLPSHSA